MKSTNYYYSSTITNFLLQKNEEILGTIYSNDPHAETKLQQANTWETEIKILKQQLDGIKEGRILFEYTIPRMGKRVDTIILHENIVFVLEFKCGDSEYRSSTYDQVYDYALDLRNFQKESHNALIVPIIISTQAPASTFNIIDTGHILAPLKCNSSNIRSAIESVCALYQKEPFFDYIQWQESEYLPTPTIVEAAQALYRGHNVHDITRNDAGTKNLSITTDKINQIIEYSKANHRKSICFVTGVPGAGKTLVGLNVAIERSNAQKGEHAVFLSGNFPLVTVLQEALARDKVEQSKNSAAKISKTTALRETSAFIQIIHQYRDSFVGNNNVPPERIAVFDEAQRAWTKPQIAKFMATKKGIEDFKFSEPEFLINTMDRHEDWTVIICLVGGGQEINTGEAGLIEWFDSLKRSYKNWDVYVSSELNDTEYRRDRTLSSLFEGLNVSTEDDLHLSTSIRSFRTPDLAAFVKAILDVEKDKAKNLFQKIKDKYPLLLTRDLEEAKNWIKQQCKGSMRYGLIASSGALRLKPRGIFVKNEINVANWFLNDKFDVRSSYYLEDVVSKFDIQGLELDYSLVAWDGDFRFDGTQWTYNSFVGNRWQKINSDDNKLYLKNAYRVLLTRARQGMVIYVPEGDLFDETRKPEYYDKTYEYLKSVIE